MKQVYWGKLMGAQTPVATLTEVSEQFTVEMTRVFRRENAIQKKERENIHCISTCTSHDYFYKHGGREFP